MLTSVSVRNYIETFNDNSTLIDKLSSHSSDDKPEKIFGKELYGPHRTPAEINAGIKAGNILQGVYYMSRTNFKEATVNCEAYDQPILIKGRFIIPTYYDIRCVPILDFPAPQSPSPTYFISYQTMNQQLAIFSHEFNGLFSRFRKSKSCCKW